MPLAVFFACLLAEWANYVMTIFIILVTIVFLIAAANHLEVPAVAVYLDKLFNRFFAIEDDKKSD